MINFNKILNLLAFLLAFHAAYVVAKNKELIFTNEDVNFSQFPIEVIIELLISFVLITFGSTMEYLRFDEIYIDKQNPEKKLLFSSNNLISFTSNKGSMLNYFAGDYIPLIRYNK